MSYRVALLSLILPALVGCSRSNPPVTPQLVVNREMVGFGTESGLATYIGQVPQDSLDIKNGGSQDLVISGFSLAGDNAFTYVTSATPLPFTVAGLQHTVVSFYFRPTAARMYSATFTITSNATNTPSKVIDLRGQGVNPPDGGP
jgi:hypothetical protein